MFIDRFQKPVFVSTSVSASASETKAQSVQTTPTNTTNTIATTTASIFSGDIELRHVYESVCQARTQDKDMCVVVDGLSILLTAALAQSEPAQTQTMSVAHVLDFVNYVHRLCLAQKVLFIVVCCCCNSSNAHTHTERVFVGVGQL